MTLNWKNIFKSQGLPPDAVTTDVHTVWYQPYLKDGENVLWKGAIKRGLTLFDMANYPLIIVFYLLVALCIIYRKSLNGSIYIALGLIIMTFAPIIWALNWSSWSSRKWTHAVLSGNRLLFKWVNVGASTDEAIGAIYYKNIAGVRIIDGIFGKKLLAIDGVIEDLKNDFKSASILKRIPKPILLETDNAEKLKQILQDAISNARV